MPWNGTAQQPQYVTPIRPPAAWPMPEQKPGGNFLAYVQALPVAEGVAIVGKLIDAIQMFEREETRRQEILADKDLALAKLASGERIMAQLVAREYDNKDAVAKAIGDSIRMMAHTGNAEAAIELSRLLLEKTLSGAFVKELIDFRNKHVSVGMIEITARPVSGA